MARGDLLVHTERAAEAEQAYRDALARPAAPAVQAGVAWRLAQCLLQRGKVSEALTLCDSALVPLAGEEDVLRSQIIVVRSQAHLMLSEFDAAVTVAAQACAIADRVAAIMPDVAASVRARGYSVLGITGRMRGQPAEAAGWLARSLEAARTAGLLHALAMISHHRCEQDKATALLEESCALRRRMGDRGGAANTEHSLALVLMSAGQIGQARDLLSRVVEASGEIGERRSLAHYLDSLAMITLVAGDVAAADGYLARAAGIANDIGEPRIRADIGRHQVICRLADIAAATRHAAGMVQSARSRGYTLVEGIAVRIQEAIAAAESGSPPAPDSYPRLIWVGRRD